MVPSATGLFKNALQAVDKVPSCSSRSSALVACALQRRLARLGRLGCFVESDPFVVKSGAVQPLDKASLCRFVSDQVLSSVQALGKAAVAAYGQKLLSAKPSGVLLGDQALLPKFDAAARRFSNWRGRLPPGGAVQVCCGRAPV